MGEYNKNMTLAIGLSFLFKPEGSQLANELVYILQRQIQSVAIKLIVLHVQIYARNCY